MSKNVTTQGLQKGPKIYKKWVSGAPEAYHGALSGPRDNFEQLLGHFWTIF